MNCRQYGLNTGFNHGKFVFYKLLTLIPVSAVIIGLIRYAGSIFWLLGWFGIFAVHFTIIYFNKCPYCPYYKNGEKTYRCFMIRGMPKIRPEQSGSAPKFLKHYVPFAMFVMIAYPIYWLHFQWELLVFYLLGIAVLVFSIMLQECSRCTYFDCGNNTVPDDVRKVYTETAAKDK